MHMAAKQAAEISNKIRKCFSKNAKYFLNVRKRILIISSQYAIIEDIKCHVAG